MTAIAAIPANYTVKLRSAQKLYWILGIVDGPGSPKLFNKLFESLSAEIATLSHKGVVVKGKHWYLGVANFPADMPA